MFPSGKVIIITRDPRDIICSFKKTTIAKKNDYLIALFNFVDLVNYYSRFNKKIKKYFFSKIFRHKRKAKNYFKKKFVNS